MISLAMEVLPVCMLQCQIQINLVEVFNLDNAHNSNSSPPRSLFLGASTVSAWPSPQAPTLPAARHLPCSGIRWCSHGRGFMKSNQCVQIRAVFQDEDLDFSLVDSTLGSQISGDQLRLNGSSRELSYDKFGDLGNEIYHWKLPSDFLGNKVWCWQLRTIRQTSFSGQLLWRILGVHPALCSQARSRGTFRQRSPCGTKCNTTWVS